jgi:hypothetical protein
MKQAQFAALIEGLCRKWGLEEPERIVRGGPVAFGGVVFSLAWDERRDPDSVFIYCDFGTVSHSREAEVYKSLLEANMALYGSSARAYTVSPDTGHVVMAEQRRLDQVNVESLHALLGEMQVQARSWQAGYSLTGGPGKARVPATPAAGAQGQRSTASRLSSLRHIATPAQ